MSALLAYAGVSAAGAVVGVLLGAVQLGLLAGMVRDLVRMPAEDAAPFRFGLAARSAGAAR